MTFEDAKKANNNSNLRKQKQKFKFKFKFKVKLKLKKLKINTYSKKRVEHKTLTIMSHLGRNFS